MLECKDGDKTVARIEKDEGGYYLVTRTDYGAMLYVPYEDTKYGYTRMLLHFSQAVDKYALAKVQEYNG